MSDHVPDDIELLEGIRPLNVIAHITSTGYVDSAMLAKLAEMVSYVLHIWRERLNVEGYFTFDFVDTDVFFYAHSHGISIIEALEQMPRKDKSND